MSKYQKSKKARRPNIPMSTSAVGGGTESVAAPILARPSGRTEGIDFDYTHIKGDLTRILTLAGVFIAILVGLSFIIK